MHILLSLLLGTVILAIAILSVQNATVVVVKYLLWQWVPMPVGVVLTFSLVLGMGLVAVMPLWRRSLSSSRGQSHQPPPVGASQSHGRAFTDWE